jgi:uncharacterized protein YeaO (DUF488 family)
MEEYVVGIIGSLAGAIFLILGGFCKLFFGRLARFENNQERHQTELRNELKEDRKSVVDIRMGYVPKTVCAELRQDGQCQAAILKALIENNSMISEFKGDYTTFTERMHTQGKSKVQNMQDLTQQIQRLAEQHSTD